MRTEGAIELTELLDALKKPPGLQATTGGPSVLLGFVWFFWGNIVITWLLLGKILYFCLLWFSENPPLKC